MKESTVEFHFRRHWLKSERCSLSQGITLFWSVVQYKHIKRSTGKSYLSQDFAQGQQRECSSLNPEQQQVNQSLSSIYKAKRKPRCSKKILLASGLADREWWNIQKWFSYPLLLLLLFFPCYCHVKIKMFVLVVLQTPFPEKLEPFLKHNKNLKSVVPMCLIQFNSIQPLFMNEWMSLLSLHWKL